MNSVKASRPLPGIRALVISVVAAAIGYLAFSLWGGWQDVLHALAKVSAGLLLLLLLLSLLNYGLRFSRWQHFLGLFGHQVNPIASLRIYLGGFALTTTPGKAGEALRSILLLPHGVGYPHSLAALLAERLGDLLAIVLLASIGLAAYPQGTFVVMVVAVALVAALLLMQRHRWLIALDDWLGQRLHGRMGKLLSGLIETVLHSSRLFTLPLLGYSIVLGLVAWGAEGLAFYYLAQALGAELSLANAMFIYAFSMLVGAVSFLPGGLGGAELTMVALLLLHGMPQGEAVAATVIIRLATLWFAVLLGALALLTGDRPIRE
ncbi:MAG: flippase-like domain-containing protein [Gammaproteobacteria bacterium]|nr:flippase-like domain-containing protein [Gammaproteobacteria bacterium]MCW8840703.1 flippase-like domain-containing protein [Gammaproteobacteria bacterium]MCW8927743.1 flippase-like domain-containing protein [Gammaproteobacteria bacterium]MCW8959224.1 flippase-like domain-containing protein [Gammaproteobacteria bacterium]MCW8973790.1 flippase-like domain-containing protein [Gammaproteobacteria bacterium]